MPAPADGAAELDVSVVVPVYHNESTLAELHRRLVETLEGEGLRFELIFVDDGSRDGSWRVLEGLAEHDARVRPLRLARNYGQAAALSAGLDRVRGAAAVTLDADLQNFPEDIPALLAELAKGHDLVSGVRVDRDDPRLGRRLPSRLFNWMAKGVTGIALRDYGCGLCALDRRVALELARHGEMRRFLKPLAAILAESVSEVPVRHVASPHGPSRYTFAMLLGVQLDFFTSFSRKPFQRIGIVGLLLFAAGFLGGAGIVAAYLMGASTDPRLQTLVVLALMFGVQFAVLGLLGEFIVRIFHAQNQPFYVVRDE